MSVSGEQRVIVGNEEPRLDRLDEPSVYSQCQ